MIEEITNQVEQTAVVAAEEVNLPGDRSPNPPRLPLQFCIEHAAVAQGLSFRQLELVTLLGQGLSMWEIAERMGLAPHTTTSYLVELKEKTGMSRNALAMLGYMIDYARR